MVEFAKAISTFPVQTLVYATIAGLVVWLFKEVKNSIVESQKAHSERFNKALEIYGEVLIEASKIIGLYGSGSEAAEINFDAFNSKLSKGFPYFTSDLLQKTMELQKTKGKEEVERFINVLEKEIIRIKAMQKDLVSYRDEISGFDEIRRVFVQVNAGALVQSLIFVIGSILLICVSLLIIFTFVQGNILGAINIIFMCYDVMFYVAFVVTFINVFEEKRFIHSWKNWALVVGMIIAPAILLLFLNQWYISILSGVLLWLYVGCFLKGSLRRQEG